MSNCKVHNVRFYNLEARAIHCMTYQSRYKKLALSRSDNSVEVWDVSCSPHIECWLPNLKDTSVESLGWCGSRLFSTGLQGLVVEYNLVTLSQKYGVPVNSGPAWCLDISRNETHLAVGTEDGCINIFEVVEDALQYVKVLDRQEGRIMCLKWDATGDVIVTGSIDTVRIWNVHTGHAVHRMTTGRNEKNKETIVWCLTVTNDFTIISGDSRGRLNVWNGQHGTLIESFSTHTADILAVCLNEEQNSVYCSGIDTLIVSFTRIEVKGSAGEQHRWVKSVHRRIHDHDVRALVCVEDRLFSGGVDGYLAFSSYPPKILLKYPPILQAPCAMVCQKARYILLRHPTRIEVWQLSETSQVPQPVLLLTLNSRGEEPIVCAAMSDDGQQLVYSTPTVTRFFILNMDSGQPQLRKVSGVPLECGPSHQIMFTRDDGKVVVATGAGDILLLQLKGEELVLMDTLHTLSKKLHSGPVYLMEVSADGKFLVVANHKSCIAVWDLHEGKMHCCLPKYLHPPTALGIQPETHHLVVTYGDHKIVEYSLPLRQYTQFSTDLNSKYPKQWLSKGFPITNITFDTRNLKVILLHDDSAIYVIDKNKKLPSSDAKIPRLSFPHSDSMDSSQGYPCVSDLPHAFHVIKKYKHLVYLCWLGESELVAVEVSPSTLAEHLPPILKRKRFGM